MDNQQPNPEEGRVQRLSRKRVLSNNITWETPQIKNKIYIYKLVSSENINIPRYIGISDNPIRRLSHHTSISKLYKNNYKNNWINLEQKNGNEIIMIVFDTANTVEEALIKEEYYITKYNNLTNYILKPTLPNYKKCYLYNIYEEKTYFFTSLQQASKYLNITISGLYRNLINSKWLFSYENNFKEIIKRRASIKTKHLISNDIKYFINHRHAAYYVNCSIGMINLCLTKHRKSANNWLICKINDDFIQYENNHFKKIKCINDGLVFNTIKEASKYYNIDSSCIVKVCKKTRNSIKKYKFEYLS